MAILIITWSSFGLMLVALGVAVFGIVRMRDADPLLAARGRLMMTIGTIVAALFLALFAVGIFQLRARTAQTAAPKFPSTTNTIPPPAAEPSLPPSANTGEGGQQTPPIIKQPTMASSPFIVSPTEGAAGRVVTLIGSSFGDVPGTVLFIDREGKETVVPRTLPSGCTATPWTQTAVFIVVPPLVPGTYTVRLESSEKSVRVEAPFRITARGSRTALCRVEPRQGIPNATTVTIVGEEFGGEQGSVFFGTTPAPQIVSWTVNAITVRVPERATSGLMRVVTKAGVRSNEFPFSLSQCTPTSCGAGETCCGDGACRADGTCPAVLGACTYRWTFSTGTSLDVPCGVGGSCPEGYQCNAATQKCNRIPCGADRACPQGLICDQTTSTCIQRIGNTGDRCSTQAECRTGLYCNLATGRCADGTPKLVEESGCTNTVQSPTPYRGRIDACTNARIGARFTVPLDPASFSNSSLEVSACGIGPSFDDATCTDRVHGTFVFVPGQGGVVGLVFAPGQSLKEERWYRARIKGDLRSVAGVALEKEVVWPFRTRRTPCTLDHVEVTPSRAVVLGLATPQAYRALPTAANCNILPHVGPFAWSTKAPGMTVDPVIEEEARAFPREATGGDGVRLDAELQKKKDFGTLIVRLEAPVVTEVWPSCASACRNAEFGIRFSQPMNPATLSGKAIRLEACESEICAKPKVLPLGFFQSSEDDMVVTFALERGVLEPGTRYRITLSAGLLKSRDGSSLGGVATDLQRITPSTGNTYQWTWETMNTRALCAIDSVSVAPQETTLTEVFARTTYAGVARSAGDACRAQGQRLVTRGTPWAWSTNAPRVAALVDDGTPDDALSIVEARGGGTSAIATETSGIRGSGQLHVLCNAVNDQSCRGSNYGVGSDRCCYSRPILRARQPEGSGACRNGVVTMTFDQPMDPATVQSGFRLERETLGTSCTAPAPKGTTKKTWCGVPASLSANVDGSVLSASTTTLLEKGATMRVTLDGAVVKNRAGVAMGASSSWTFTTGDKICQIRSIRLERSPGALPVTQELFTCMSRDDCPEDGDPVARGNQHLLRAVALDQDNHPVDARFTWGIENGAVATLIPSSGDTASLTSLTNGATRLSVTATATQSAGGTGATVVPVVVKACDNPWPPRQIVGDHSSWSMFADSAAAPLPSGSTPTNFETYYCRDRGASGPADDLPLLAWPPVYEKGATKPDLLKGFVFQVVGGGESDAIGIEVFANRTSTDLATWYRNFAAQNKTSTGQPESLIVNGFPALRDGRTVYVDAPNVSSNTIYTNVYLISTGVGASPETEEIARQLLQQWRFVTNITSETDRTALTRDIVRFRAMRAMRGAIDAYREKNGRVPKLEAGSFIPNLTFSTWPISWARLSGIVGSGFPSDPRNAFIGCAAPYDQTTCWDPKKKKFQCPKEAYVYAYTTDAGGNGYTLATQFEYVGPGSWKADPQFARLETVLKTPLCTP